MKCFKAYDIRGKVPEELDSRCAYAVGKGYAELFAPEGPVAVGYDIRETSRELADALIAGLNDSNVDTWDIGLCGTEMVYFAATEPLSGGGIMITASHNPVEYNGMKLVRKGAIPISGDTGLRELETYVDSDRAVQQQRSGNGENYRHDVMDAYTRKILSFVDVTALRPLKLVLNPGNGCAGPILKKLLPRLPFEAIMIQEEPDGTFPNGVPNPLLPANRQATSDAVRASGADLGVAWDGDCDRCFFFDEQGNFADGYYIVGLLSEHLLSRHPGETIIYDPRMTWNTLHMVAQAGGRAVQGKTGHAFMKELMRQEDALYGGEMSAHHYFREFFYCDSGMIPWLIMADLLSTDQRPLSSRIEQCSKRFPGSGEINNMVKDPDRIIDDIEAEYSPQASAIAHVDGLSMEFTDGWRFNLRKSQTEPILRLNVETRGDPELLKKRTSDLLQRIRS